MKPNEARILRLLRDDGPKKARSIAERLYISKGHVYEYLGELLDDGEIEYRDGWYHAKET